MSTLKNITDEERAALKAYAAEHGRKWIDRLHNAWLNDWREQWGTLRMVRNNYDNAFDPRALRAAIK